MQTSNPKIGILILSIGLLSLVAMGCEPNHNHEDGDFYCDDSGCFRCDWDSNCWPTQTCEKDKECPEGFICSTGGCLRECELEGNCAQLPDPINNPDPLNIPDPTPQSCESDEGCAVDHFCDEGTCTPRCQSDDDCGEDMVCSSCGKCQPKGVPATCGTSQLFCTEEISCGTGKTCLANRCHFNCTAGDTCGVGQICSEGICLDDPSPATPECVLDYQCGSGTCINGYCHAGCEQSTQCGSGALCIMSVCQADYNPVQ